MTTASFREATEDRAAVIPVGDGSLVVVVADGAGGLPGGGRAADLVVASVEDAVREGGFSLASGQACVDLLAALDHALERDDEAGETTAIVVNIAESRVVGASCGDSEAWVVTDDDYDVLTGGQHRKRRLGSGRALPVGFAREEFREGTLVVATDGLWSYATTEGICDTIRIRDFQEIGTTLVDLVRTSGGELSDDVAVILVQRARGDGND